MSEHLMTGDDKKVEYVELIYDLIFVYLVGRNNSLLHATENGFFSGNTYLVYLISSLVILQVWYFSMVFINRYGNNGAADHVALFVNMYLLYYMADGSRTGWFPYYARYNAAWGLILLNLAFQYFRKLRTGSGAALWETRHLKYHMRLLLLQAAVVLLSIPLYSVLHVPLSSLCLLVGFVAAAFTEHIDALMPVNFEHLTERVMLYIVFTFGEMIVSIAEYFEGGFSRNTFYFSLMAFLIVVGLFLVYGYLYNHIIDREASQTTGTSYMLLHIVLTVALSNLTVALEFMRQPEVDALAKSVFLIASFLLYYYSLFFLNRYAHEPFRAGGREFLRLFLAGVVFAAAMLLAYRNPWVNIAISVVFVYAVFGVIALHCRRTGAGTQTLP